MTPSANDAEKFATYYRDQKTGLDYAIQRYYQSGLGRFLTPDPYLASGGVKEPQSWNRYAYVVGDPVRLNDPTGLNENMRITCIDGICGGGGDMSGYGSAFGSGAGYLITRTTTTTTGSVNGDPLTPRIDTSMDVTLLPGDPLDESVRVVPNVPFGAKYTGRQMRALANGLNNALSHLVEEDCAELFASGHDDPYTVVRNVLDNTTYRLLPTSGSTGAYTTSSTEVTINRAGAFFTAMPNSNGTVTVAMPNPAGISASFTFVDTATLQGLLLLHELGHQMGVFGRDLNAAVNGANTQAVLDHCFRRDAQGVYH